ncbi:hypothetical protein JCM11641_001108 [Rhodosporidiobolus odoratus]
MPAILIPHQKKVACVTGASGLVGAAIAVEFLRQGHSVRLPLRRQEQIDAWHEEYGSIYPGQIVGLLLGGKIWEDGVFHDAVTGADAVVHTASPMTLQVKTDAETDILKPAIAGTLSILESARRVASVRSVAITSSHVWSTYTSMEEWSAAGPELFLDENSWNPISYEEAAKLPLEAALEIYATAKAAAELAAFDFATRPDVHFAVSAHAPALVLGRNYAPGHRTLKTIGSTLAITLELLWNQKDFSAATTAAFDPNTFASIEDVARAHVAAALNPQISANKRYLLISARSSWKQLIRYMIKARPVLKGHLPSMPDEPTEDEVPSGKYGYDASRFEVDFGYEYQTMEEIAASFADYVYGLTKAEGAL